MPCSVPVREVSPNNQQYEVHPAYFAAQGPRVIDADGDGQDDIILVERDTGIPSTPSQFVYYRHKRAGFPPDRLVGIHEGLNASPATLSIDYTPMTKPWVYERGAACDHRKQFNCAINPYYVVSQVRRDAGLNGDAAATTIVSEYAYKSSITHKISRAWLGFAEQRVRTAPSDGSQSPVTVRRFYSNTEAKRDPRLVEEWTYGTIRMARDGSNAIGKPGTTRTPSRPLARSCPTTTSRCARPGATSSRPAPTWTRSRPQAWMSKAASSRSRSSSAPWCTTR
jgi:hypothetical protein